MAAVDEREHSTGNNPLGKRGIIPATTCDALVGIWPFTHVLYCCPHTHSTRYCFSHFIDVKTEAQRDNLSQITGDRY